MFPRLRLTRFMIRSMGQSIAYRPSVDGLCFAAWVLPAAQVVSVEWAR